MKRLGAALATLAVATLGTFAVASPAQAEDPLVLEGSVISAPDNGAPPWARDDLTIKTTISDAVEGVYDIRQEITGTWVSELNADITGTVTGFIEYEITGTLLVNPAAVLDDGIDLSSQAVKSSPSAVAVWALQYFAEGAVAGEITDWEYVYDTACEEPFTEPTDGDVGVGTFDKVCPEETTTSPSTATTTTAAAATLPVTGPSTTGIVVAGSAIVVVGVILLVAARKRRDQEQPQA